jgi:hypothetical protein
MHYQFSIYYLGWTPPPYNNKEDCKNLWRVALNKEQTEEDNPSLPNRACWLVMRDESNFTMTDENSPLPSPSHNTAHQVLYFCGTNFQPEQFAGWQYFVDAM